MVNTKFANLGNEQLNELKSLEEKLGVTLLAYDHSATKEQSEEENSSSTINPS